VSGNTLVGVYYAVTMVTLVSGGGLSTTNGTWLLLCPLMALLLVGARSGAVWLGVIVATVIALARLHAAGLIAKAVLSDSLFVAATSINVVGCTLVAFGCAFLYEISKRQMLVQVDSARREAERAFTGARLVLDHIDEALMIVRRDGTIEPECSAAVARIFGGKLNPDGSIWSLFTSIDARAARWVELGWPEIFEDVMPVDLVLGQLPARLECEGRAFDVTYATLSSGERVLVIVRDVTDAIAAENAEREERQIVQLLARLARDRSTFLGFWDELADLVARLADTTRSREQIARNLHTIKGNAGILGLEALARLCHDAEDHGVEAGVAVTEADRARIAAAYRQLDERMRAVAGLDRDSISVPRIEYESVVAAALEHSPNGALTSALLAWGHDSVAPRLELLAERSMGLARRLDKGDIAVEVDDGCTRVPHGKFAPFFAALAHVVRNAIDHGLETPQERASAGKSPVGRLRLCARIYRGDLIVAVVDDGRGIDWERVAAKAAALGLPHGDHDELVAALFTDGVTSRADATTTSGRGLGLAAVATAVAGLGGRSEVESERGAGTRFTFTFPADGTSGAGRLERVAPANDGASLRVG
jgi:two-component system chemotaxis sensor kinase CheA